MAGTSSQCSVDISDLVAFFFFQPSRCKVRFHSFSRSVARITYTTLSHLLLEFRINRHMRFIYLSLVIASCQSFLVQLLYYYFDPLSGCRLLPRYFLSFGLRFRRSRLTKICLSRSWSRYRQLYSILLTSLLLRFKCRPACFSFIGLFSQFWQCK
jgi:hypothetical protein